MSENGVFACGLKVVWYAGGAFGKNRKSIGIGGWFNLLTLAF
jgi:hypothetical protein